MERRVSLRRPGRTSKARPSRTPCSTKSSNARRTAQAQASSTSWFPSDDGTGVVMPRMNASRRVLLFLALALNSYSQTITRQNLETILGFENGRPGAYPAGWVGGPTDTIFIDDQVVH